MLFHLIFFSAIGSGLMAGVFFAFSTFVMKALAQLTPPNGIKAMQAINNTVLNPLFLFFFIGTAFSSLFLIINSMMQWLQASSGWLAAGSFFYLGGSFLITVIFHVPWNNQLAKLDPNDPQSTGIWGNYLSKWIELNHLRTVGALAATILFIIALIHTTG